MKKVALSSMLASMLVSSLYGAEDLASAFASGKVSGEIREFSIGRSVSDTRVSGKEYYRSAHAIGGYLKYETGDLAGLSFGSAFYATNGFWLQENKTDYFRVDPTLLGVNNEGYSILGEAYLQYKNGNTVFKGGRQKLDTPLAGSDDARMLPNLFEAYLVINTDLPSTTLIGGHVTRFAQGTFGRAYTNGVLAATSGYSAVDARNQVGDFVGMGAYAIGKETDGVSVLSATYSGIENLKLQIWDYYAIDILNAYYGQADYAWSCLLNPAVKPFAAVQFIKEDDVGGSYAGEVDSLYWAAKLGFKIENFSLEGAYSATTANDKGDGALKSAIITPWGGMPAFTQGMVTRHMFMAGTEAMKAAASYSWKGFGVDLTSIAYYTQFTMDELNGYTEDDASESGFDLIYKPSSIKNLQLRLRANYARDFYVSDTNADATKNGALGWDEYRFITTYTF